MPNDKVPDGRLVPPDLLPDLNEDDFFKNLENPDICQVQEVDISKPDWEVIIYFDAHDPKIDDSDAARDFWLLEEGEALGLFQLQYITRPLREVVLRHSPDCCAKTFGTKILTVMANYRVLAKAPLSARQTVEIPAVGQQVQEVLEIPDYEEVLLLDENDLNKITAFDFDLLAIKISDKRSDLAAILERLHAIAENEELDIKAEDLRGTIEIYFSKKEDVNYAKPMDSEDAVFLEGLDYLLVD